MDTSKSWTKRFDKRFPLNLMDGKKVWIYPNKYEVLEFIQQELSSQKKDLRDKVREMKFPAITTNLETHFRALGYSEALSDVLKLLK